MPTQSYIFITYTFFTQTTSTIALLIDLLYYGYCCFSTSVAGNMPKVKAKRASATARQTPSRQWQLPARYQQSQQPLGSSSEDEETASPPTTTQTLQQTNSGCEAQQPATNNANDSILSTLGTMAELLKQQQAAFLSMQSTLSTLPTNLHHSLPNNTNQTLQPTAPVLPSNLQNFIPPGELKAGGLGVAITPGSAISSTYHIR